MSSPAILIDARQSGNIQDLLTDLLVFDVYLIDTHPLYPFYLAIKSFVLCEANYVFLAHTLGYIAVEHAPTHIYAIHSITHALHEQACWGYLCEFLEKRKPNWITNKNMRIHISWHLAIAYEKNHLTVQSLHTFHEMYALKDHFLAKQDLDAVAYLWRYHLKHPDDRQFSALWQKLACLWSGSIGTSMSYFHQLHAALAFAACHHILLIKKLIAENDDFGIYPSAHKVGKKILQAILFFAQSKYQACYQQLKKTQNQWPILGGSKAQRELLLLTMHTCLEKIVTRQLD